MSQTVSPKPRYKYFGVEITRPAGRIRLEVPVKNWTEDHAAIMRQIEKELVKMFAVKRLRAADSGGGDQPNDAS